jgi:hypothetical protein
MLGLLAHGDNQARELLLGRIAEGDNDALAAYGDLGRLDIEVAGRLMAQDAQLLHTSIAQAQTGHFAISRTRDPAARLAILGVHFPDVAPWDALLGYLGHDRVPSEHKRLACLALAEPAGRLPEEVRSALRDLLPQLAQTTQTNGVLGLPFGGAALMLAAAIGALDDQTLTSSVAGLLAGSRQERRDAATLIGRLSHSELTVALVTLIRDPYPDVRAEAAHALASRVASPDTNTDLLAVAGLQRALTDPGARTPLAIAYGITAAGAPSDEARELIAPLLEHPSALVREAIASALNS